MPSNHSTIQRTFHEGHLQDVQDLFTRKRGGTYIRHAFVTPEQLARWSDFMKWPFYEEETKA